MSKYEKSGDKVACGNCGAMISPYDAYCAYCGAKQRVTESSLSTPANKWFTQAGSLDASSDSDATPDMKEFRCKKCGSIVPKGTTLCGKCSAYAKKPWKQWVVLGAVAVLLVCILVVVIPLVLKNAPVSESQIREDMRNSMPCHLDDSFSLDVCIYKDEHLYVGDGVHTFNVDISGKSTLKISVVCDDENYYCRTDDPRPTIILVDTYLD